ncbi:AMIN-like domain-containing (lipo)protein [Nocardia iowensis]|uniref:AMIN-like domain-containing protein n=1 Tax=Nocardia iowensis TaxID=204891 RepID=A0ABX8RPH3_NOCIO|nr:hypothetical protein [Nocardia iowensis]QXN91191.1 hypothetical protein KV110_38680 [Nocardia iowensis]
MRRIFLLIASVAIFVGLLIIPGPAAATPPYCGLVWGSLDKASKPMSTAPITGVRSGRHDCFDRLVFDLAGPAAGYRVGYVEAVTMDGSGAPVPLRGGAFLNVVVLAPAYDDAGNATYLPANRNELVDVTGYQTFRQVAWAGSFEGQTTVGLGVRGRLPMRAFTLDGPGNGSRVVVDVAHFW